MEHQRVEKKISVEDGCKIVLGLPNDDLRKILFLLIDMKDINCYKELSMQSEKMKKELKHIYALYDSSLILESLYAIKKYSSLKRFNSCKHQTNFNTPGCIEKFRKFLFSICEELTDNDVSYVGQELNLGRNQFTSAECLMCELLVQKTTSGILTDLRKVFKKKPDRYGSLLRKFDEFCDVKLESSSDESFSNGDSSGSESENELMVYPVKFSTKSKTCGVAVILNQVKFKKLSERNGSNFDKDKLMSVWEKFGFEVIPYENLKAHEIKTLFQDLARRTYECPSVFIACLLSHGNKGGVIFGSDDIPVPVHSLLDMIANNCQSLYRMPKLFFIQACKGEDVQEPLVTDSPGSNTFGVDEYSFDAKKYIPHMCDTFVAYATVEGYASLRSKKKGTIFIQELIKCLEKFGEKEDISFIMKRVTNSIAAMILEVEQKVDAETGSTWKLCTQMPEYRSTLRGILKFKKPVEE